MGKFDRKISIDFKCSENAYRLLKLIDPSAYLALKDPNYLIEIAPEDFDSKANFEEKRTKVLIKLYKALRELLTCKISFKQGGETVAGFNLIAMYVQSMGSDSIFFRLTDVGAKWLEANQMFFSDSGVERMQNKYHFFKPELDYVSPRDLLTMKI